MLLRFVKGNLLVYWGMPDPQADAQDIKAVRFPGSVVNAEFLEEDCYNINFQFMRYLVLGIEYMYFYYEFVYKSGPSYSILVWLIGTGWKGIATGWTGRSIPLSFKTTFHGCLNLLGDGGARKRV
jgi:hypothetical protein